jgi:hypothetical protein
LVNRQLLDEEPMKSVHLLSLLIAGSLLSAACGETVDDTEVSPDPEFGLETLDGKADSFAIRPGSPEAKAVVDYVNRPLANDAEGNAFRDELDATLYSRAAKNIAAFRAGADGSFGTADDETFETITDVDRVPWVGRSSLMSLFELAEAAGLFQRASVDCAEYLAHDRYDNYRIESYADLLEIENSECTTIDGNLTLEIAGTSILPPSAREIDHLRHLRTIDGDLTVIGSTHFHSIDFQNLESVTGTIDLKNPRERGHTVDFPSLSGAESIHLSKIDAARFGALERAGEIALIDSDLEGFTALAYAGDLSIIQPTDGDFQVDFPELAEVGTLTMAVDERYSYSEPRVNFTGGFDELEKVERLTLRSARFAALDFPSLTEVGRLETRLATDPFRGMDQLVEVRLFDSRRDDFGRNVHSGPTALQIVGHMEITSDLPVEGYDALTTVHRDIRIVTEHGVKGFDSVATVGRAINLNIGRDGSAIELSGFNELSYLPSLAIRANDAPVSVGPLFQNLENIEASAAILDNSQFDDNPVFEKLVAIGGRLKVDTLHEGSDMMPALEIVDDAVLIDHTPTELVGFGNLERIEGDLRLRASVSQMTGMANLTAIGGNISVPRSLAGAELDDFLNQLSEFSGTITYN